MLDLLVATLRRRFGFLCESELQVVPEMHVAINECWILLEKPLKSLAVLIDFIALLNQIGLHTRLEQQRVWLVNLFHLGHADHVLLNLILPLLIT